MTTGQVEPIWEVGELPFHVGPRAAPTNAPLPESLPFRLGRDKRANLLVQIPDPDVEAALDDAYRTGSQIGTPLADTGLGRRCRDDFLQFVLSAAGRSRLDGLRILEIGAGSGALLDTLHGLGAEVVGVEPGAPRELMERPYPVIAAPFRPELLDGRFDLIVHYGVLEHVPDVVAFTQDQLRLLTPRGLIIFSVPECAVPLAYGDISMLVHEHWSYFTESSLARVAALAGAETERSAMAGVAGARYSAWRPGRVLPRHTGADEGLAFAERARRNLERLRAHAEKTAGGTLGIYCPGRFVNYEALLRSALPPLRYFDDDPLLEGRYYPPSRVPVETRAGLIAHPPSHLLVASLSFGDAITAALRQEPQLAATSIVTFADVLTTPV